MVRNGFAVAYKKYSKRYYFGVPAPTREKEFHDDLGIKRIEMIKIYNSLLKQEVLSRGSYFLDVYALTSTQEGENNNLYMWVCDVPRKGETASTLTKRV